MLKKNIAALLICVGILPGTGWASSARWAIPTGAATNNRLSPNIAVIPRENYDLVKREVEIPDFIPKGWNLAPLAKPFNLADYAERIPVDRSPDALGRFVTETYGVPQSTSDLIFSPQANFFNKRTNGFSVSIPESAPFSNPAPKAPASTPLAPLPETIKAKLRITNFEVTGNSLLSHEEIDGILSPYENKELSGDDLKALSAKLTELYHKKGYGLAQVIVPSQNIYDGTIQLHVKEGKLGQLIISGNKHYSSKLIASYLAPGIHNGIIKTDDFQRGLLLLNDLPGVHAVSFFKFNDDYVNALINVDDKPPLHTEIDYNNYGNRLVAQNNAGIQFWHDNLFGFGDSMAYRQTYPVPSNIKPFVETAYSIPVNSTGTKLLASYANADIKLGQELQVLDIRGTANIYTLGLTQALVRTGNQSSNLFGSISIKNAKSYFFSNFINSDDRVREATLGFNLQSNNEKTQNALTVSVGKGLGTLLGGMGKNDPLSSRRGIADDLFTKFNLDAYRIQALGGGKYLLLRGGAQFALNPLLATEQYALGGPFSVRGYPQSQFLGDSGWNFSIEGRLSLNGENAKNPIQGVLFFDTGYVNVKNTPGSDVSVSGAGFGVRASIAETFSIQADLGYPLSKADNTFGGRPILYFQGITTF